MKRKKMKKSKKIILFITIGIASLIILLLLFIVLHSAIDDYPRGAECLTGGGLWMTLPDPCSGNCMSLSGDITCAAVLTKGCNCGPDRCWNGDKCIINGEYDASN